MTNVSLTRLSILLGSFLGLTYTLCVVFGLAAPTSYRMYPAWEALLPGFNWLTVGSFFIGLGEVLVYGVYAAVLYSLLRRLIVLRSPGS